MKDKKTVKCESELCCKATAALNKKVEEEMKEEDKPLEELLKDGKDQE